MAGRSNVIFPDAPNGEELVASSNGNGRQNRKPTEYWLNIGKRRVNPETGEEKFVSLPLGAPLDGMEPFSTNSRSEDFKQFRQAQNTLLAQVQKLAGTLDWGEEKILTLEVQLRRIDKPAKEGVSEEETNPYAVDFDGLVAS